VQAAPERVGYGDLGFGDSPVGTDSSRAPLIS
jgi:hypothetical protein